MAGSRFYNSISQQCTFKCNSVLWSFFPPLMQTRSLIFLFLSEVYAIHILHCHTLLFLRDEWESNLRPHQGLTHQLMGGGRLQKSICLYFKTDHTRPHSLVRAASWSTDPWGPPRGPGKPTCPFSGGGLWRRSSALEEWPCTQPPQ